MNRATGQLASRYCRKHALNSMLGAVRTCNEFAIIQSADITTHLNSGTLAICGCSRSAFTHGESTRTEASRQRQAIGSRAQEMPQRSINTRDAARLQGKSTTGPINKVWCRLT